MMLKIGYAPDVDVLKIQFSQAPVLESDEEKAGVILDYDAHGNIVGLEVLGASTRMDVPHKSK